MSGKHRWLWIREVEQLSVRGEKSEGERESASNCQICCLPPLIQPCTISAVKQKLYNQEGVVRGREREKKNHNSALIPSR